MFVSLITCAAVSESCDGLICFVSGRPSNCSRRPVTANARRYATTLPGPLSTVRLSNRTCTSSHASFAANSRMYASCLTKFSLSDSAVSNRCSKRSARRLAGIWSNHARMREGTSFAKPAGAGADDAWLESPKLAKTDLLGFAVTCFTLTCGFEVSPASVETSPDDPGSLVSLVVAGPSPAS